MVDVDPEIWASKGNKNHYRLFMYKTIVLGRCPQTSISKARRSCSYLSCSFNLPALACLACPTYRILKAIKSNRPAPSMPLAAGKAQLLIHPILDADESKQARAPDKPSKPCNAANRHAARDRPDVWLHGTNRMSSWDQLWLHGTNCIHPSCYRQAIGYNKLR